MQWATWVAAPEICFVCFAAAIGLFVFGVARWDWFLTELGAVFLGLMGLAAVLGGLDPNRVAREFGNGAAELTSAALIIGFARTIEVVLDDAPIKDTVIHGITAVFKMIGKSQGVDAETPGRSSMAGGCDTESRFGGEC